jgi:hypothetical protein
MNKIDRYIDSIYNDMNESSEEIQELKEEMRGHLIQTISELKKDGISEEESINIAIDRFGDEFQIRGQLKQVLKFHKVLSRNILGSAIIFSVICILSFIVSYSVHRGFDNRFNAMQNQVHTVRNKLVNEGIDSADKYIREVFEGENNQLIYIRLTELPNNDGVSKPNIRYFYPEDIESTYGIGYFQDNIMIDDTKYLLETGINEWSNRVVTDIPDTILAVSTAVCVVLWLILIYINIFKNKELNKKSL